MKPFPWTDLMQAGLGRLRLPPDQFWRMTPREMGAALTGLGAGRAIDPPGRDRLGDLLEQFPDEVSKNDQ